MVEKSSGNGVDTAALFRKYEEEKAKRVRAEGMGQYARMEGKLAHFQADPNAAPLTRDPVSKDVEVAILGSGWGGIHAGVYLRQAGIDDVCIIDKAADFGGVWYWNRYPGVACDTESYVYMPLLEEMGVMPKANYASGPEIMAHAQAIARKFGLYDNALLQTSVKEARWDEPAARWIITTDHGDTVRAKYFVMTSGSLQLPKLPGIPGIEEFKGHSFHTSRWDFAYTGGDAHGGLTKLKDKRVAIIGTGATAIQCIPHLAQWSKHLTVVQRTPSAIDVRNEHPTDEAWYKSQPSGWQMKRIENFTDVISMHPVKEDLVNDGWTRRTFAAMQQITPDMSEADIGELLQLTDYRTGEEVRARVDAVVKGKATAESLKAWYNRLCKRPCFHDGYLDVYNRENVTLIDTQGKGVERITATGLVADGKEVDVDCIVYSTGFELGPYTDAPVIPVIGRGGVTLADKWASGATTLHGFHVHGFPNFLMVSITQSAWGANFMHMLLEQGRHVAYVIKALRDRAVRVAEVTEKAEQAWVDHHVSLAPLMSRLWENCTPGFFNNEGKLDDRTARSGPYGAGVRAFVEKLEQWRQSGDLEGLALNQLDRDPGSRHLRLERFPAHPGRTDAGAETALRVRVESHA